MAAARLKGNDLTLRGLLQSRLQPESHLESGGFLKHAAQTRTRLFKPEQSSSREIDLAL